MPPKPAAAAAPAASATPELTPEQQLERFSLIQEAVQLSHQKTSEQSSFQEMSDEKERISLLWAGVKKQCEDAKAEVRERERARIESSEAQAYEVKLYQQRIKRLLFEQQREAVETQTEGRVSIKAAQELFAEGQGDLRGEARDLKGTIRESEVSQEYFLRALRADGDRVMTEARLEFEREAKEVQNTYEERMTRLRDQLTAAREDEVKGIESRKTRQVQNMITAHERAFTDIKLYYNEITHSNLDLIKTLKDEVEDLKKKEASDEKVMFAIAQENKKMSEPMRKALDEVRRLREAREVYRKDISQLHETKAEILLIQDRIENLKWEVEILQQRFARVKGERDTLYDRFTAAMHEVRQKAGFRQLLLEERVSSAANHAERQGVLLREVVAAAGVALPRDVQVESNEAKDKELLAALQSELNRVAAEHDRAITACLTLMHERDIPPSELGFAPLDSAAILGQ
jgi:chromosome segregation ATPase